MSPSAHYEFLREAIDEIPAVSAHDHLCRESEVVAAPTDLFHLLLSGFPFADMVSAGMERFPADGVLGDLPPPGQRDYEALWKRREPWLDHIRDTSEYRTYLRGVQELFDFEGDIDDSNWRELNDRIRAAQKPGWHRKILLERGKVDAVLLDRPYTWAQTEDADRLFTCNVYPLTDWVALDQPLRQTAGADGGPLETLDAAVDAFERALAKAVEGGIIGLKLHQAYMRPLEFDDPSREDAARDFPRPETGGWTPRPVQDYMANLVARRAAELGIPLAIHTGYQIGNGNDIRNANATLLTSMLRRHPATRFDLFHLSYPYWEEVLVLAKYFPNVYLNFAFADLLSARTVVEALHLALDLVPSSKVFAWGADSGVVEATYGSLCVTRDCVARMLSERVADGTLTRTRALRLARKFMGANAAEAYGIEAWRKTRGNAGPRS
jgi:uncharacterized protein